MDVVVMYMFPLPLLVMNYALRVRVVEDYKVDVVALTPEQVNQVLRLRGVVCGIVVINATGPTVRMHKLDVGSKPFLVPRPAMLVKFATATYAHATDPYGAKDDVIIDDAEKIPQLAHIHKAVY
jgi:hypothetical protein